MIRETVYKCRDCGHEYLLAYSCKGRYFCTSCHTMRAVAFAAWLHSTVLWPVAHRQIVLTIPKTLRVWWRAAPGRASSRRLSRPPPVAACGPVDFEYIYCED